jgi:hypothetical protein
MVNERISSGNWECEVTASHSPPRPKDLRLQLNFVVTSLWSIDNDARERRLCKIEITSESARLIGPQNSQKS